MSNGRRRGGKGGAEPLARILGRRRRAWDLAVRGRTQREIAEVLEVSQAAVSKMVRRAGVDAWEELRAQTRHHVARQCSQLDYLFRESIEAWEQSKRDHTRRRHQRVEGGAADAAGVAKTVAEAVATTREGDPRFLATALQALREKRELLTLVGGPAQGTPVSPGDDPWADTSALVATLTTEELKVLYKLAEKRIMMGSGFEDHQRDDRALARATRDVLTARRVDTAPATAPGVSDAPVTPSHDGSADPDDS